MRMAFIQAAGAHHKAHGKSACHSLSQLWFLFSEPFSLQVTCNCLTSRKAHRNPQFP